MILIDCPQGSTTWHQARMGIPTASCFDKIIQPVKMKPSASADEYLDFLLSEWSLGRPIIRLNDPWMDRGKDEEPNAAARYELEYDLDTDKVGFVLREDRMVGCSPDRLVGRDGLLEIKVPKVETHMRYMRVQKCPNDYKAQIQGQLWLTDRRWCDFVSYNPVLPLVVIRVERDEAFIEALAAAVNAFVACLVEGRERLAKMGIDGAPRGNNGGPRSLGKAMEQAGNPSDYEIEAQAAHERDQDARTDHFSRPPPAPASPAASRGGPLLR